jgi:hypothetical protein
LLCHGGHHKTKDQKQQEYFFHDSILSIQFTELTDNSQHQQFTFAGYGAAESTKYQ